MQTANRFSGWGVSVTVVVGPDLGIPQGSPESPVVYAAVVERATERVERRLADAQKSSGLAIAAEGGADDVEADKHGRINFVASLQMIRTYIIA